MKRLSVILSAILFSLSITSCSTFYPDLYEEEITDVVKYSVSTLSYASTQLRDLQEEMNNPIAAAFASQLGFDPYEMLMEEWAEMEEVLEGLFLGEDMTYREALLYVSNDDESEYSEACLEILYGYDNMNINLSQYDVVLDTPSQKSWAFKELRSGVEFTFSMHFGQIEDVWIVEPMSKSVERYLGL